MKATLFIIPAVVLLFAVAGGGALGPVEGLLLLVLALVWVGLFVAYRRRA